MNDGEIFRLKWNYNFVISCSSASASANNVNISKGPIFGIFEVHHFDTVQCEEEGKKMKQLWLMMKCKTLTKLQQLLPASFFFCSFCFLFEILFFYTESDFPLNKTNTMDGVEQAICKFLSSAP